MNIVVDLDGTIVDTNRVLEKKVRKVYPHFSMRRVLTYDYNKSLTSPPPWLVASSIDTGNYYLNAPRDYVLTMYDPCLYHNIRFFKGVVQCLRELASHENVIFYTLVQCAAEAESKKRLLAKVFKGQRYNFVWRLASEGKPPLPFADIVFDDCYTNLAVYPKSCKRVLIHRQYNHQLVSKASSEGILVVRNLADFPFRALGGVRSGNL